jgi:hypothetical protein
MDRTFLMVLGNRDLFSHVTLFQMGRKICDWNWDQIIESGHYQLLIEKQKKEEPPYIGYRHFLKAITLGNLEVVKWVLSRCPLLYRKSQLQGRNLPKFSGYILDFVSAQSSANIELVKYLNEMGFYATTDSINYAAGRGNLEVIQYLLENRSEGFTEVAITIAVTSGHPRVVRYLFQNQDRMERLNGDHEFHPDPDDAWKSLNPQCIDLLEEFYPNFSSKPSLVQLCQLLEHRKLPGKIAEKLKNVSYLRSLSKMEGLIEVCVKKGNLEFLEFLDSFLSPEEKIYNLNEGELLLWILKNPNWNFTGEYSACFQNGINSGNVELLDFLLDEKKFLPSSISFAFVTSVSVCEWVQSRGLFSEAEKTEVVKVALKGGIVELFDYLCEKKIIKNKESLVNLTNIDIFILARNKKWDFLQKLVLFYQGDIPIEFNIIPHQAILGGRLDLLQWFHNVGVCTRGRNIWFGPSSIC